MIVLWVGAWTLVASASAALHRPRIRAEPAESYVEYDNRHGFHNAHEFAALYPDDTRPSFGYCLPLVEPEMPELSVIRARLFERAATLGHSAAADRNLHRVIDATAG